MTFYMGLMCPLDGINWNSIVKAEGNVEQWAPSKTILQQGHQGGSCAWSSISAHQDCDRHSGAMGSIWELALAAKKGA